MVPTWGPWVVPCIAVVVRGTRLDNLGRSPQLYTDRSRGLVGQGRFDEADTERKGRKEGLIRLTLNYSAAGNPATTAAAMLSIRGAGSLTRLVKLETSIAGRLAFSAAVAQIGVSRLALT